MTDQAFLDHIEHSAAEIEAARISVGDLRAIYEHHQTNAGDLLQAGEVIQSALGKIKGVHSTRVRVKSPKSLARKIVRKHNEDFQRNITLENYREDVRDLIGLRALHLLKEDWEEIHQEILIRWNLHPKDKKPIAYYRKGDAEELVAMWKRGRCTTVAKDAGYRSVHYVIVDAPNKAERCYAELQVRTVFEEAWSEIDHRVRYPDLTDNPILQSYLLTFNRMVGGADEMGSFLMSLKEHFEKEDSLAQQREQELVAKERDLLTMREALQEAVEGKHLSEGKRKELEETLARVPDFFKRDYERELQEQTQSTYDLVTRFLFSNRASLNPTSIPDPRTIDRFNQQAKTELEQALATAEAMQRVRERRRKRQEKQEDADGSDNST